MRSLGCSYVLALLGLSLLAVACSSAVADRSAQVSDESGSVVEPRTTSDSDPELRDPSQTVLDFFDAFQLGDFPTAFLLLDSQARGQFEIFDQEALTVEFTGLANRPAWGRLTNRTQQLTAVLGELPLVFQRGQIVLEEAVRRGALPVDITAGVSDLVQVEQAGNSEHLFTAVLNSTGEQVEIRVVKEASGEWAIRRIGLPGVDPDVFPFGGPPDAASEIPDQTAFSSTYDELDDDSAEAALAQVAALAESRNGFGIFLMLDDLAQWNAVQATVHNERWLLTAEGQAGWETAKHELPPIVGSDPRRFANLVNFGLAEGEFSVPLAGFTLLSRSDSRDVFEIAVAVFEAEHPDVPGTFTITMRREARGWRLRQILAPDGAPGRYPFAADSDIAVWAGAEGYKTVSIDSLSDIVLASVAETSTHPAFEWRQFVDLADHPLRPSFRHAWVDLLGDDDAPHVVYIDIVGQELPWKDIRSPQEVGRAIASRARLDGDFVWDYEGAIADWESGQTDQFPIEAGLGAFDTWVAERVYGLVGIHSEFRSISQWSCAILRRLNGPLRRRGYPPIGSSPRALLPPSNQHPFGLIHGHRLATNQR